MFGLRINLTMRTLHGLYLDKESSLFKSIKFCPFFKFKNILNAFVLQICRSTVAMAWQEISLALLYHAEG